MARPVLQALERLLDANAVQILPYLYGALFSLVGHAQGLQKIITLDLMKAINDQFDHWSPVKWSKKGVINNAIFPNPDRQCGEGAPARRKDSEIAAESQQVNLYFVPTKMDL